jgi:rhodanese-related sulfurtransferase
VLLEALAVSAVGLLLALLANHLSPHGLVLGRNYFPRSVSGAAQAGSATATNLTGASPAEATLARLKQHGLQAISFTNAVVLFRDPRHALELVVFVDAREEKYYLEGHIPGAYNFDHYRPEKQLPMVLAVCQTAEQIVVYCAGGNCEDSEFAAVTLSQAGVPANRLFVFPGGIAEWTTNGLPLEVGPRKSGDVRSSAR